MNRSQIEVADIFRKYGDAYRQANSLPLNQLRVMNAIEICRTKQLGGHVDKCDNDDCAKKRISYNSCMKVGDGGAESASRIKII